MSMLRRIRTSRTRSRPVRSLGPLMGVEGLERRVALTVSSAVVNGQLQVSGDDAGNVITLDHVGSTTIVNDKPFSDSTIPNGILIASGGGNDLINVLATAKPVTVNGSLGLNNVGLGKNGDVQGVKAAVSIVNVQGQVTVDDSRDPTGRNVSIDVSQGFTKISNLAPGLILVRNAEVKGLTVRGPAGVANTFNVLNTGNGFTTSLETGFKNDLVNVVRTTGKLDINGQNGNDKVVIGNVGNVQGILGEVTVRNTGGFTSLTADDSLNGVGHSTALGLATVNSTLFGTIDGLAPARIKYVVADVNGVTVKGGGGGNAFHISDTPSNGQLGAMVVETGQGVDQVFVTATTGALSLNGNNGKDTVQLGDSANTLNAIRGPLTLTNTGSHTDLLLHDEGGFTSRKVTMAVNQTNGFGTIIGLAPAVITYQQRDVRFLTVNGSGAGNTFTVADTATSSGPATTILNTGLGGDVVNVLRTSGSLQINGQSGRDHVNVGLNRSYAGIKGTIGITNASSFTDLLVDASADSDPRVVQVTENFLIGLGTGQIGFDPDDLSSLTIFAGSGGNNVFVRSTSDNAPVTINAGSGNDTVRVGDGTDTLDRILGTLTVNGQLGSDTLIVNDQGSTTPHTYTISPTQVRRSGAADINYSGIQSLQVNKGPSKGAPLIKNLAFTRSIQAGKSARLGGRVVDPDLDRALSVSVDWGDGSTPTTITPGDKQFSLRHRFSQVGAHTVRVFWTDSTGESNFRDLPLTVKASKPRAGR